jgi:hypothetical protein
MGCALSLVRSEETNQLCAAMKDLVDGSWGDRHSLIKKVRHAVEYCDEPGKLDLSVRYKGWNALHIAAYHGDGDLMLTLSGGQTGTLNLNLASSVNRPQGASVLMCVCYGKTSGLSTSEWKFEQAGFKMIYQMSDEQLGYADANGCTALHYAAVHGVVKMVAALMERCPDHLEKRGIMNGEGTMMVGMAVKQTQWWDDSKDDEGNSRGWQYDAPDREGRTPLEIAQMRYKLQQKHIPDHANSQRALKEVIELLEKATAQPELPTAVPVITTMLTVAMVPEGQKQRVATPKGALEVEVPKRCGIGTFFQFTLPTAIPVADFKAWPRDVAIRTVTVTTTTQAMFDTDGDGAADVTTVTTTHTAQTVAAQVDLDGDGVADGVLAVASTSG